MGKVVIVGSGGSTSIGKTIEALIDNEDIIVVSAEEAKNLGIGQPEPMMLTAPPIIEEYIHVEEPKRRKNRKKRKNTFGQSKFF